MEADERWGALGREVGTTKQEVRQTELAFLAPPSQRHKARYLNLGELLRWGVQTLAVLDQPTDAVLRHVAAERPEASRDAQEARDYLEGQQAGLGQAFLDRLNETLAGIGALPEM